MGILKRTLGLLLVASVLTAVPECSKKEEINPENNFVVNYLKQEEKAYIKRHEEPFSNYLLKFKYRQNICQNWYNPSLSIPDETKNAYFPEVLQMKNNRNLCEDFHSQ